MLCRLAISFICHFLVRSAERIRSMDKKELRSLAVAYLVLGMMLVGQSTASFESCYGSCFILCVIIPTNTVGSCTLECLKDCIIPTPPLGQSNIQNHNHYNFCKLGCASTLCSNFSTKQNPGTKSFFLITPVVHVIVSLLMKEIDT